MTKKEFIKLAKKHLTIDEKQNMAFGRKFKYISGIEGLYKAMNFTRCCESDSEQLKDKNSTNIKAFVIELLDIHENPQNSNKEWKKVVLENAITKIREEIENL